MTTENYLLNRLEQHREEGEALSQLMKYVMTDSDEPEQPQPETEPSDVEKVKVPTDWAERLSLIHI